MTSETTVTMGMPQLDIHTLSEDWALATGMERTWLLLAESLGRKPSLWRDGAGARMYAAVMALRTSFDLGDPIREDDEVTISCRLSAIRKPHARAELAFAVDGRVKAEAAILTSFIVRDQKGSNRKFSKVRDIWQADDLNPGMVDDWLERHHAAKTEAVGGRLAMTYEINRIQDFNAADFLYFKNFVRIARAAEWRENRGRPARLNAGRTCYFFGNVEDGDEVRALVGRRGDATSTVLEDAGGRRLFLCQSTSPKVRIAEH